MTLVAKVTVEVVVLASSSRRVVLLGGGPIPPRATREVLVGHEARPNGGGGF